jgi:hypothetical protein
VAFTEHGAVMAATILNSTQAVQMSILVVRAFIAMRSALLDSKQLAAKLDALEKSLAIMDADTRRQFKQPIVLNVLPLSKIHRAASARIPLSSRTDTLSGSPDGRAK